MGTAQGNTDLLWLIVCSALIFQMQVGFLFLESGLTRRKNSINVAVKNLADFCATVIVFWGVGFALMFGDSNGGWFGTSSFFLEFSDSGNFYAVFFWFQAMFCAASITIMSGAAAERMRFTSYLIATLIVSAVVYPVFGHWTWGGIDHGEPVGWLRNLGFVDFAGSTVVHSVGGWASLALLLIIGPRAGRFTIDGKSNPIRPSNLPMATVGALVLFLGFMGFNGGSALALDDRIGKILLNTIIAGSAGALSAGLLGQAVQNRLNVTQFIKGTLGGLVAITASCFAVTTPVALLIGLVGGMIVIISEEVLEHCKIDDAVGAVPVHLAAGVWGTLAVGLYGDLEILGTGLTRIEQIGVQLLGIAVCGIWVFAVTYSFAAVVNRYHPLRVPLEHELIGLNISEHGEFEDYEIPGVTTPEGLPVAGNEPPNHRNTTPQPGTFRQEASSNDVSQAGTEDLSGDLQRG